MNLCMLFKDWDGSGCQLKKVLFMYLASEVMTNMAHLSCVVQCIFIRFLFFRGVIWPKLKCLASRKLICYLFCKFTAWNLQQGHKLKCNKGSHALLPWVCCVHWVADCQECYRVSCQILEHHTYRVRPIKCQSLSKDVKQTWFSAILLFFVVSW